MNPRLRFKQADGTDYPDWEEKKLGELGTFIRGLSYSRDDVTNKSEKSTLVLRSNNITESKMLDYMNDLQFVIKEPKEEQILCKGDIVICMANGSNRLIGKSARYNGKYKDKITVGAFCGIFRSNCPMIAYIFQSPAYSDFLSYNLQGGNGAIGNLKGENLKQFSLLIPSDIEEQQKIGNFLSDIDEVILASDQEVKKLQELKKGVMQKIFSQEIRFKKSDGTNYPDWEEKKLGDICNSFSGGTPRTSIEEYYNGNINFIRSGEIHDSNTELFISEEGLKNSSAKIVNVGDILLALYGATSGEIDLSKINGAINQAILCIRPQEGFNKKFIVEIFRYNKNNILKFYLQGGQGNLSAQNILKLNFPFPCLEEQEKIGDFLSDFDEAISLAKQEFEKWKLLKKGILQQMFV